MFALLAMVGAGYCGLGIWLIVSASMGLVDASWGMVALMSAVLFAIGIGTFYRIVQLSQMVAQEEAEDQGDQD